MIIFSKNVDNIKSSSFVISNVALSKYFSLCVYIFFNHPYSKVNQIYLHVVVVEVILGMAPHHNRKLKQLNFYKKQHIVAPYKEVNQI